MGFAIKYPLQGADTGWEIWNATHRDVCGPGPGRYQFQVRAMNADGIIASSATLTFTIPESALAALVVPDRGGAVGVVVNALLAATSGPAARDG